MDITQLSKTQLSMKKLFNYYGFPIELQIEILKYSPFLRCLNKQFYKEGKYMFNLYYGNIPISKNEFIKYQTHFFGTIFYENNHELLASYLRQGQEGCGIKLHHNPFSINPLFYCNAITYYKNYPHPCYHRYTDLQKNLKYQRENFYDFTSTFHILEQRGCFKVDYTFKKNYIDSLFISNGSDFDNLNTKLKYILYLIPLEDLDKLNLNIQLRFRNEKIIPEYYQNYLMVLKQTEDIYQHYYQYTLSTF